MIAMWFFNEIKSNRKGNWFVTEESEELLQLRTGDTRLKANCLTIARCYILSDGATTLSMNDIALQRSGIMLSAAF